MKKVTWWKDVFRNIRKRFVSWLSIVTIVFIGITAILGLFFIFNSMDNFAKAYIEEHNFKDLDVVCSLGVKNNEIEKIKALEGVYYAEGQVVIPSEMSSVSGSTGVTLMSITEKISVPYALQGELPTNINECAVSAEVAKELNVKIGDEVEAIITTVRFADVLKNNRFKITGIAADPDFTVNDQTFFCVLTYDTFDASRYAFDYTNMLVDVGDPGTDSVMSRKYNDRVEAVKQEIEATFDEMSEVRIATLGKDLDEEYAKAKALADAELKKGRDKIEEGQREFDEKIGEAKKKLDDGEAELYAAKSKAQKELADAEKKIRDGEAEYNTKIADGERQLAEAEANMEKELENARFKLFDGFLQIDKNEQLLNQKEAEYQAGVDRIVRAKEQLEEGRRKYDQGLSELDKKISRDQIRDIVQKIEPYEDEMPEISRILDRLWAAADMAPLERAEEILDIYEESFETIPFTDEDRKYVDELIHADDLRSGIQSLKDGAAQLEEGQRKYENGLEELEEGRKLLDQGWFSLGQAKQELANGQAEYAVKEPQARKQLADARADFEQKKADGAKELEDAKRTFASKKKEAMDQIKKYEDELAKGREEFEAEKEKGEKQLADAWKKYEEERKKAMDKLAEAKKQIDEAKTMQCTWLAQTRNANYSFLLLKSAIESVKSVFYVFTPIFSAIIVIVCYFTMVIITEEQTKQIGACKALGFYNSEIRNKYIVFGATAAIIGSILGIIGAFQLENVVVTFQASVYVFDSIPHTRAVIPVIAMPILVLFLTCAAVYFSCAKFLHCSAVGLVSGNEPVKRVKQNSSKHNFGNVYFKLILNNFAMDLGREIVSVAIIIICVWLIGLGVSIKLGFSSALERQAHGVWQFDIKVNVSENVTDEERKKIEEIIEKQDYIFLADSGAIIEGDNKQILSEVICIDDMDAFRRFYVINNTDGEEIQLTDDAILVTQEMAEKNGLKKGNEATIVNNNLKLVKAKVGDNFAQHAGKTTLISEKYFKELFGSVPDKNTYFIKVTDGNVDEIKDKLFHQKGVSDLSVPSDLIEKNKPTQDLFNIVVVIIIIFSILLSFMILLNLSNILVAHRMREIMTMRVNGFSSGQVIGYLAREIVATLTISVIIALITGFAGIMQVLISVETDGFMYIRHPMVLPWVIAVLVNIGFSVTINSIAFRKINKVPLTDISKY